jgi:hypothetical protein
MGSYLSEPTARRAVPTLSPLGRVLQVGFEDADAGEVAIALGEIEAVADDKLVGDLEAHEVGLELDLAASAFVEEHTGAEVGEQSVLRVSQPAEVSF